MSTQASIFDFQDRILPKTVKTKKKDLEEEDDMEECE